MSELNRSLEHRLKSNGERMIASVLNQYGIPLVYEPRISVRGNTHDKVLVPDFYLPTRDVFVEYFGRIGSRQYDIRHERKMEMYKDNQIALVALYPWDLCTDWPRGFFQAIDYATPNHSNHKASRSPYRTGERRGDTRRYSSSRPVRYGR